MFIIPYLKIDSIDNSWLIKSHAFVSIFIQQGAVCFYKP